MLPFKGDGLPYKSDSYLLSILVACLTFLGNALTFRVNIAYHWRVFIALPFKLLEVNLTCLLKVVLYFDGWFCSF